MKLDISKAFDSVDWAFLLEIMSHLGFGTVWRNLISNLLQSASTQVILNGELGSFISHQRGLHQGDPLSPMLFILVMDVLNNIFAEAVSEGLLAPLHSAGQRLSLYVDDVSLFIRPEEADLCWYFLTLIEKSTSARKYCCSTSPGSIQGIVFSTGNGSATIF